MVQDINPGAPDSAPASLVTVGSKLFFAAQNGVNGREVWTSDGTDAGTSMIKDIAPATRPEALTNVAGTVFFTANDGVTQRELWKTDGTDTGTSLVKDIRPGKYASSPESLTAVDGTLYVTAIDGVHGRQLWKSDGTDAGTVMVKDINAGGGFQVSSRGRLDTRRGTETVKVNVEAAGTLRVAPAAGSLLRKAARVTSAAGTTSITLKPTRAGLRVLRRDGVLKVKARFTFTPCGGAGSSVVRQFVLRLK
jgi:ELWxxDGT repeat protein